MSADAGLTPRGPDRRKGPQREADRRLHYARENLLAVALALVDDPNQDGEFDRLSEAAAQYRQADAATQ